MLLKFCLLSKPSSTPLQTGSLQEQLLKCNTQILLKECPAYLSKVHCNWSSLLPDVCILSFCGNWMGGGRVISDTGATVLCQFLQKVIPGSRIYFGSGGWGVGHQVKTCGCTFCLRRLLTSLMPILAWSFACKRERIKSSASLKKHSM